MATQWFYEQGGTKHGPVDSATLRELASSGKLKQEDLLWKEGMAEWRPAGDSKKLFTEAAHSKPAVTSASAGDAEADTAGTVDEGASDQNSYGDFLASLRSSVLIAVVATIILHTLQWFVGWGWGSLWAILSSTVILSCGILPWMREHEGHRSPAATFGAGVGAVLGAAYGWFTGGLLSGILFCTSAGTWAAWLGNIRGITSKTAQVGLIVASLTGFHFAGMLSPRPGMNISAASVDEDFDKSVKRVSQITLGTDWANVVYLLGNPLTQTPIGENVFVAKWPASRNPEKTFIGIVFRQDKYGRPGLKRVYVEAVSVQVNGKEIYSLP